MKSVIDWLANHRLINLLILVSTFLLMVLPHKSFGTFLNTVLFKGITRDQYNTRVLLVSLIILAILSFFFYRNTRSSPIGSRLRLFMLGTLFLSALVVKYLFVINIEVVHFPQYALYAVLLFPVIGHYTSTLIWATVIGAIDEAYQFFYLSPNDTGYYDFNDVVTNLLGAAFGLIFLRSFGILNRVEKPLYKTTGVIATVVIAVLLVTAFAFNILSLYPTADTYFEVMKIRLEGFWHTVHPGITYHVLRPWTGLLLTVLLWLFYSLLEKDSSPKNLH